MKDSLMQEVTARKMISKNGNSLTLNITKEADMIGLDWKDEVIVTLRRSEDER